MFKKPQNRLRIPGSIFKTVLSLTDKDVVARTPAVTMSDFAMGAKVSEFSVEFIGSLYSQKAAACVEGGLR